MPILKNAKKALRTAARNAAANKPIRSRVKTSVDEAREKPSASAVSQAFSAIDRAVKKNILHKKKAARMKSRLAKRLK
jgi:small subunit ribosomal protein S20